MFKLKYIDESVERQKNKEMKGRFKNLEKEFSENHRICNENLEDISEIK